LALRTKKKSFSHVLHIVKALCGKVVNCVWDTLSKTGPASDFCTASRPSSDGANNIDAFLNIGQACAHEPLQIRKQSGSD